MPTTDTAVQQLSAVAETLCAAEDTGDQTARQYRWTVGMVERALTAHRELFTPDAGDSLAKLLTEANTTVFLDLAESGALRRRAGRQQGPASEASMTVVRTRLQGIATAAGLPPLAFPPLQQTDFQAVHPPTSDGTVHLLRDHLEQAADRWRPRPDLVRVLAMVAIVCDTAARSGELAVLTLDDYDPATGLLHLLRYPPRRDPATPPQADTVLLAPFTRAVLAVWIREHRAHLVSLLEGSDHGRLWVAVAPNHNERPDGTTSRRPPGAPLEVRGTRRALERGIISLNAAMLDVPGWQPLTTRAEQLRRAVALHPVQPAELGGRIVLSATGPVPANP
jgi:hypothetical protein